ncbi:hypothetical protein BHE74_00047867 [Ensete ventricosum]|nr:hypothetical protein BHE74_00047867 [Ensete ventricosum]
MEEVLGRSHWGTLWSSALVGTIRSGVRLGSTEDSCTKASSVWVSRAPSNNKGWKTHYLFISGLRWGFRLEWLVHSIATSPRTYMRRNLPNTINLARLHGMPKVLTGKLGLMARAAVSSPEVEEVPTKVALRSATTPTPKKPTERINATS